MRSPRDIVLIAGGLFLLYKGTREVHHALEGDEPEGEEEHANRRTSFAGVITRIALFDVVFSLDSVITAVGMANTLWVMASAIVIAVVIMLVASGLLADFVQRYPTVKMLALSFLMLIGMTLIVDGAGFHVPKGYIYAAIGFSVAVEALNQLAARRRRPRGGAARRVWPIKRGAGAANMRKTSLSAEGCQSAPTGGGVDDLHIQLFPERRHRGGCPRQHHRARVTGSADHSLYRSEDAGNLYEGVGHHDHSLFPVVLNLKPANEDRQAWRFIEGR
jgi:Integral membrane protein TerC family